MEYSINDRIEGSCFKKNYTFFRGLALTTIVLGIAGVLFIPGIFQNPTTSLAFVGALLPFAYFYLYRKLSENYRLQYIEWHKNSFTLKFRQEEPLTLKNSDISNISIKLEEIILTLKDEREIRILMGDFCEFSDRYKIKKYFEEIVKYKNAKPAFIIA